MQSRWRIASIMALIWIISLLYGEMLAFWLVTWTCNWPPLNMNSTSRDGSSSKPLRVAVIADPQLTDRTTHHMAPGSIALKATQFYSDIYMRRSFRSTVLTLAPDEIIFLGDYIDGGPQLSDDEYHDSYHRFLHIFDQSERGARSRFSKIPVHYLSGNHDLGYAGLMSVWPEIVERYEKAFGDTEHIDRIGAVDFIFVNAQVLDGSLADSKTSRSWSFLRNLTSETNPPPRVLLSHIPLYRPDDTPCGIHRTSPVINQRISLSRSGLPGIIYQNYLTEESTIRLLDYVKPILILSGHDHDQCSVKHRVSSLSVMEHTVGSFSWQNGNFYPSFMLLSVASAASNLTLQDSAVSSELCFLPCQTLIYAWYAVLLVSSLVLLLAWPSQGIDWNELPFIQQIKLNLTPDKAVKAKEKDADDYEMVWDAEGVVHLIKKISYEKKSHRNYGSQVSSRGAVTARPAVKRQLVPDAVDVSTTNDGNKTEQSTLVHRPKSRTAVILRRFKEAAGPLVALVAVNLGLYVMLLAKDWTGSLFEID